MASAAFSVNGSTSGPIVVTPSSTVNLALLSTTGVRTISWSIEGGSDHTIAEPVITPAGSPLGATATLPFTTESVAGLGLSWIVQCVINGGTDDAGQPVAAHTARLLFGKLNAGTILPLAFGETLERNATHGVFPDVNKAFKTVAAGAAHALDVVLGVGNNAGGVKITNLGAPTVGSDATTKTYVDGRSLAQILAVATSAGGAKITSLGTPTNGTDAATKAYVDGLLGGGGGETLEQTLILGSNANGQNITGVGILASLGELTCRQGANNILRTATGTTILSSTSAAIVLRKVSNDIVQFNETAAVQSEMLFAAVQPVAFIGAAVHASGHGVNLKIAAGSAGGASQHGGIVSLKGGAPTGSGDLGYVAVLKADNSELVSFKDSLITFGAALSMGSAKITSLGTPTASTDAATKAYVDSIPATAVQSALAAVTSSVSFNSQNITNVNQITATQYIVNGVSIVAEGSGGALIIGNAGVNSTLRASTLLQAQVGGGSPQFAVRTTYVGVNVATFQFESGVSAPYMTQAAGGAGSHGQALKYLGQAGGSATGRGGQAIIANGSPAGSALRTGAAMGLLSSAGTVTPMLECSEVASGQRVCSLAQGAAVTATQMPANTGDLVTFIGNAATLPTASAVGGGILYVDAGALKWRGSGGTITTLGAA